LPIVATEDIDMSELQHNFDFDPSYGYNLDRLLAVEPPPEPQGFAAFWSART
jgi:cephalosporin-C deacetylase